MRVQEWKEAAYRNPNLLTIMKTIKRLLDEREVANFSRWQCVRGAMQLTESRFA
jgi:hypothetical protein